MLRNLGSKKKQGQWDKHTPGLVDILQSGRFLSEYSCLEGLPYEPGVWSRLWELLHRIATEQHLEYPENSPRELSGYRFSLRIAEEALLKQQNTGVEFESDDEEFT